MFSFDKVLNQRVDWVAWAIEHTKIYGTRDAIDDACTTSSDLQGAVVSAGLFLGTKVGVVVDGVVRPVSVSCNPAVVVTSTS